jgi:hypothetical protein
MIERAASVNKFRGEKTGRQCYRDHIWILNLLLQDQGLRFRGRIAIRRVPILRPGYWQVFLSFKSPRCFEPPSRELEREIYLITAIARIFRPVRG